MTCNNCFHYNVCEARANLGDITENVEGCKNFIDSSRVIVPPCKVGDTVYVNPKTFGGLLFIHYDNLFIHSKHFLVAEVVSVIKTRKQNLIKLKVYNRTTYTPEYRRYPISSIGKTVFLTCEEAESALKEKGATNELV